MWILIDRKKMKIIEDVVAKIRDICHINLDIDLHLEGAIIPPVESISILRDSDNLTVKVRQVWSDWQDAQDVCHHKTKQGVDVLDPETKQTKKKSKKKRKHKEIKEKTDVIHSSVVVNDDGSPPRKKKKKKATKATQEAQTSSCPTVEVNSKVLHKTDDTQNDHWSREEKGVVKKDVSKKSNRGKKVADCSSSDDISISSSSNLDITVANSKAKQLCIPSAMPVKSIKPSHVTAKQSSNIDYSSTSRHVPKRAENESEVVQSHKVNVSQPRINYISRKIHSEDSLSKAKSSSESSTSSSEEEQDTPTFIPLNSSQPKQDKLNGVNGTTQESTNTDTKKKRKRVRKRRRKINNMNNVNSSISQALLQLSKTSALSGVEGTSEEQNKSQGAHEINVPLTSHKAILPKPKPAHIHFDSDDEDKDHEMDETPSHVDITHNDDQKQAAVNNSSNVNGGLVIPDICQPIFRDANIHPLSNHGDTVGYVLDRSSNVSTKLPGENSKFDKNKDHDSSLVPCEDARPGFTVYTRKNRARNRQSNNHYRSLSKDEQLDTVATNRSIIMQNNTSSQEKEDDDSRGGGDKSAGSGEPVQQADAVDYTTLPLLTQTPSEGMTIAYKVMELSATCEPGLSDYKAGRVLAYDLSTGLMEIEHAHPEKPIERRFDMTVEDDEEILTNTTAGQTQVTLAHSSLVEPRLVSR